MEGRSSDKAHHSQTSIEWFYLWWRCHFLTANFPASQSLPQIQMTPFFFFFLFSSCSPWQVYVFSISGAWPCTPEDVYFIVIYQVYPFSDGHGYIMSWKAFPSWWEKCIHVMIHSSERAGWPTIYSERPTRKTRWLPIIILMIVTENSGLVIVGIHTY